MRPLARTFRGRNATRPGCSVGPGATQGLDYSGMRFCSGEGVAASDAGKPDEGVHERPDVVVVEA